jgi:uncharacterized protein YbjT (DUF2867 family)
MTLVLVTGGTGHLGQDLVDRLLRDGHQIRVFARTRRSRNDVEWAIGDLATGEGLPVALRGVHTVINAATHSPVARRGGFRPVDFFTSPSEVDAEGTRRLLDLSQQASVQHFLHVSIVGLDEASLPYARVKLKGERMVRESGLPWSVVRATPFYYLLESMLAGFAWLPVWPVPKAVCNPVDTTDVADHLARCAFDGGRGERVEIGGPEDLSLVEYARQYLAARGMRRSVVPIHVSEKTARSMGFVKSNGVRGALSWKDWLSRRFAGLREAA